MGWLFRFVFILALLYVLVGGGLYFVRLTMGKTCAPSQVHAVRAQNPDMFMGVVMWGPDAWRMVVKGSVDIAEFVMPMRCVPKPAGK